MAVAPPASNPPFLVLCDCGEDVSPVVTIAQFASWQVPQGSGDHLIVVHTTEPDLVTTHAFATCLTCEAKSEQVEL